MQITSVHALYFSPCGSTRMLAERLVSRVAANLGVEKKTTSITLPAARTLNYSFASDELVVVATPTYAGKLPNKLLPYLKEGLSGGEAPAVGFTTFGNRAFDNSLAELIDVLANDGFSPFAGGAFASRHAFTDKVGTSRPDEQDLATFDTFVDAVIEALGQSTLPGLPEVPGKADASYYTPLGLDGKPKAFLAAKPKTHRELCIDCALCAQNCPMEAISFDDFCEVPGTCIKCHSCVRICPTEAKYFDDEAFLSHKAMLVRDYTERKDPFWCIGPKQNS